MLSFEIGQRESGFYCGQTDGQTDRLTKPPSTVLLYRYISFQVINLYINVFKSLAATEEIIGSLLAASGGFSWRFFGDLSPK